MSDDMFDFEYVSYYKQMYYYHKEKGNEFKAKQFLNLWNWKKNENKGQRQSPST